ADVRQVDHDLHAEPLPDLEDLAPLDGVRAALGLHQERLADAGASRALDIARRVLAEAGEAPPAATRTNDGEASHD
ncbi:hypothetical protein QZM26_16735, partial [Burkholderia multivorans]|nr:hypothetical protein [Burkholderia multivorans]